jgi:hypothetical protein
MKPTITIISIVGASYLELKLIFSVEKYGELFNTLCLTESFYDSVRGIFLCNNQSVRIEKDGMILEGKSLID